MSDFGVSPLSGLPLRFANDNQEGFPYFVGEPGGPWASSLNFNPDPSGKQERPVRMDAPYQIASLDLRKSELEQLKALALGRAFQAHLRGYKFPLFVTATELAELNAGTKQTPYNFQPIAIEDLWREAQNLTVSEKANETLRNLADVEPHPGFAHRLTLAFANLGEELPESSDPNNDKSVIGLAFGAVYGERTLLFKALEDNGLVSVGPSFDYITIPPPVNNHGGGNYVTITPKGYAMVEKLRKGDIGLTRKAFLVCRFIKDLDRLYTKVYKPVGDLDEVQCPILRVKDIHHVDKIDDRIIHEIDQATIVVVDLTEQNFNVAFEAGYALALRKPIVWTLRAPMPEKLPFDIQSHNILVYDPQRIDEFRDDLKYRLLAALSKAKE